MNSDDGDDLDYIPSPPLTKMIAKAKARQPKTTAKLTSQDRKRKADAQEDSSVKKKRLTTDMNDAKSEPLKLEAAKTDQEVKDAETEALKLEIAKINEEVNRLEKAPTGSDRLGKSSTSAALKDPHIGRTTTKPRAPPMQPNCTDTDAAATLTASSASESESLLSIGSIGITQVNGNRPIVLKTFKRFTSEHSDEVVPIIKERKVESPLTGLDSARPPISTIDGIFDDIAINANKHNLAAALPPNGLRIATMCSGTEAPLLGMRLLGQALMRQDKDFLDVRHVFSAEIDDFKQAYIERNFSPPVLFRDVTDFCKGDDAETAYGGKAVQPRDVHILVAGSSCVDYSSLNQQKKPWAEQGVSYRTLSGVRAYVNRARPNIVILENVRNAPWSKIRTYFEEIGYACNHVLVDTKNYYLPQTRERGYLIGLDAKNTTKGFKIENALSEWSNLMWDFQRRANAPFSDFIYKDDDPELHATKLASDFVTVPPSTMAWDLCRHRYNKLRVEKLYGSKRPMTHWQDNGSCKFPDFGWIKWAKAQRERIWDTLDIEFLRRAAERGDDLNYKTRWLELSQNVDREPGTRRWGIIGCLTPSGMPYLTTRGGPVFGGESLILQGIPKYALNFTKETSRQLQNLAGNAMSVPVVTSAILSGILAVSHGMKRGGSKHNYFTDFSEQGGLSASTSALASNARVPAISAKGLLGSLETGFETNVIDLGSLAKQDTADLLAVASTTLQFCKCEGTSDLKKILFQKCKDCGHMTCKLCGQNPVHNYNDIPPSVTDCREMPIKFVSMITEALPTTLQLDISNGEDLASGLVPLKKHLASKRELRQAARLAIRSIVHFKHVKRGHSWTIVFEGLHSRLELRIYRKCQPLAMQKIDFFGPQAVECYWLLFATTATTDAKVLIHDAEPAHTDASGTLREALEQPIARMSPGTSLLLGKWETIRYSPATIDIKAAGDSVAPSWERSIGLQREGFRRSNRAAALEVNVVSTVSETAMDAARLLTGRYELRPQCGTAKSSLHVRHETNPQRSNPMFFFLEPEQLKNAEYDSFVFAASNYRRGYKEYRMIHAAVEEGWCPNPPLPNTLGTKRDHAMAASENLQKPVSSISGTFSPATLQTWDSCDGLHLKVPADSNSHKFWCPPKFEVSLSSETPCSRPSTFLLIELPIESYKGSNWKADCQFPIDIAGKVTALDEFRWLIERAGRQMLARISDRQCVPFDELLNSLCFTCAPKKPSPVYKMVMEAPVKGNQAEDEESTNSEGVKAPRKCEKPALKMMEVAAEATMYERALKDRPPPITAVMHCHKSSAILEVKLNIATLCHRAVAKLWLGQETASPNPTFSWNFEKDHGRETAWQFKVGSFPNNNEEKEVDKPAQFKRSLWASQARALTWMMRQELKPCSWQEKEREEVCIPALGCRIDVEARCPKAVRGGVLADEVGGGKTTTSLALVARMLEMGNGGPMPLDPRSISIDATLILVPSNLLEQWEEEIHGCFSNRTTVRWLVIRDVKSLLTYDLSSLRENDIILACWDILDDIKYWRELSKLCEAQNMPTKAGRALQLWLREAMKDLGDLIQQSGGAKSHKLWKQEGPKKCNYDSLEAVLGKYDPEKRTAFVALFHALTFRRIIIDEYSYLEGLSFLAALELKATAMWLLSGTPPTSDYDAVNTTARLLKTKITSEDEKDGWLSFVTAGATLVREKTDAERFQWYNNARSPAWCKARNQQVDEFIHKFVRKNSAEAAKTIQRLSMYEVTPLYTHEQMVYFEVFQRLTTQNFKFGTAAPETISADLSRSKRLDMIVSASDHPEDALLSCCSEARNIYEGQTFSTATNTTAMTKLIGELYVLLQRCFAYEAAAVKHAEVRKNRGANTDFLSFQLRIKRNDIGDKCVADLIDRIMSAAYATSIELKEPYVSRAPKRTKKGRKSAGAQSATKANHDDRDGGDDAEGLEPEDEDSNEEDHEEDDCTENKWFKASMAPWPDFAGDLPKKQKDFRKKYFKVRNAQEKTQAEDMNMITIEMVNEVRGTRLLENLKLVNDGGQLPACSGCGTRNQALDSLFILGKCGHSACHDCLRDPEKRKEDPDACIETYCDAPSTQEHLIRASRFGREPGSKGSAYGSKMEAVTDKVNAILKSTADNIIIFVQFPRVLTALMNALKGEEIPNLNAATGCSEDVKQMVNRFRRREGKDRVLVLLVDSVDAAGWNLQCANHVLFVSACYARTQTQYMATMTQAIGRAHRSGQEKTVNVYHFLMANTIEVNIIQDREEKAIVKVDDGIFQLVERIGSGPTEWEGPDMQGAASGIGALDDGFEALDED